MPSSNITLYLDSIRTSKAPYHCPYQNCKKSFRKIDLIEMHLNNVDHAMISPPSMAINNSNICNKKSNRSLKMIRTPEKRGNHTRSNDQDSNHNHQNKINKFIQFKYRDKLETLPDNYEMTVNIVEKNKIDQSVLQNGTMSDCKKSFRLQKSAPKSSSNFSKAKTPTKNVNSNHSQKITLPEPSYRLVNYIDNDYREPTDSLAAYYRFLDDSIDEEEQMKVEYDMDEEDAVWLELINKKRREDRLLDVNVETFELIMDRFEKESFFQSQSTGQNANSGIDEDAVCSICIDGECHNSNAILFCDMCNLAVHQECYGVPYIPEGSWLCRRCIRSPSTAVDCVLCPNKGGAFKHTDDNRWAHVICALWIPEVGFSNSVFLEPIDSISAIPAARWKLACSICHKKNVGACIQCSKTNCYIAFHVTCAQQAGLYMKIEAVNKVTPQGSVVMQIEKYAYCLNHAPPSKNGHSNGFYLSGDEDSRGEPPSNRKGKIRSKLKTARKILADKYSASTVSIPTIPHERLSKISELVSFPRRNEFLIRLYAYWKLKRQSRNGVPLLRRLHYSNSIMRVAVNKEKSKRDSIKFRNQYRKLLQLRQELERARLLLELVRKRERIKLKIIKEHRSYFIYKLMPFKMFLLHILDRIVEKDTNQFFLEPVNVDEVPDYLDYIKEPMDLGTMRTKVEKNLYRSFTGFEKDLNLIIDNCTFYNDKDTIYYKSALKLKSQFEPIIEEGRKYLRNYDQSSGLHASDDGDSPIEGDKEDISENDEKRIQQNDIIEGFSVSENNYDDDTIIRIDKSNE